MAMITEPQLRFLTDLEKRGRDFISIDKRVYSSLARRGLVEGRFSALNDGYVCITPAGKDALKNYRMAGTALEFSRGRG